MGSAANSWRALTFLSTQLGPRVTNRHHPPQVEKDEAMPITSRLLRGGAASAALLALMAACASERRAGDPGDDDSKPGRSGAGSNGASDTLDAGAAPVTAQDPNQPAAPGVPPTFVPNFPGAGSSDAGAPLTNGKLCDYVPANGAPSPNNITKCFLGPNSQVPAATLEQVLECVDGKDVVHIRLTFNPNFVDNTYGTGAIGWPAKRGHTWRDLEKSDHAEIMIKDASGMTVLQFKLDYVSADPTQPSGFGSLGVSGGEGAVSLGNPAWVVDASSSIDRNLNERGHAGYLVDSPATDANYTANPAAPDWDYRVVYEVWIDVAALGSAGFGGASIESVHASPAKGGSNTIEVKEGKCPPCNNPDGCGGTPPADAGCVPGPDLPCDGTPPPPPPRDAGCVPGPDLPCDGDQPKPPPKCDGGKCGPGMVF
jgi:hypothetical protein